MERGLKFQEFIGYGRRKDISNLKVYNSKNEEEEKNLRNHQKDDLMRLTMSNKEKEWEDNWVNELGFGRTKILWPLAERNGDLKMILWRRNH